MAKTVNMGGIFSPDPDAVRCGGGAGSEGAGCQHREVEQDADPRVCGAGVQRGDDVPLRGGEGGGIRDGAEAHPVQQAHDGGLRLRVDAQQHPAHEEGGGDRADVALFISPCYYKSKMDNAAADRLLHAPRRRLADPVERLQLPGEHRDRHDGGAGHQLSQHPNIAAVKESGGNVVKMGEIIKNTRPDFQVLAGSARFLYPSVVLGAVGGVLALANIAPQQCCDILAFAKAGKHEDGAAAPLRMIAPNTAVTAGFGVAGLKAAMDMAGHGGRQARSPMQPLNRRQKAKLKGHPADRGDPFVAKSFQRSAISPWNWIFAIADR